MGAVCVASQGTSGGEELKLFSEKSGGNLKKLIFHFFLFVCPEKRRSQTERK